MTSESRFGDRRMLIDGRLVDSESGEWLTSLNPATEAVLGRVPSGSKADIDRAVEAGARAFSPWWELDHATRGGYVRELAARLRERADEITEMEVLDTGNTIRKMRADVEGACQTLDYYSGLGAEAKGETIPVTPGNLHISVREPYGVVGRIVAFNHPIKFTASRMAAPLMAGNAVVMKPPEQAPLSSTVLAEICAEVFPPGVVNIVTGLGGTVGDALVRHPEVRRLALIGSVPTGMAIQRAAAESGVKNVTLELGGKNPMIVFPDADLSRAIPAAVAGMNFGHQGQSCGSTSRLFLHDSIHDQVLEKIVGTVDGLRVGDPMSEDSDMGAMVSPAQLEKTNSYIKAGKEDGARLVAGGGRPEGAQFERGYWVRPTVFADVTPGMRIFNEEIFGPVLSVIRWSDADEVVQMANSVEYGLAAAVWTEDLRTAVRTAKRVKSGYVWINGVSRHYPACEFGGMKNSGVGTEEGLSELLSYTQVKTIHFLVE